jgi:membrane protease YdiL (CAAX protease family)
MSEEAIPPVLEEAPPDGPTPAPAPKWRWVVSLLLLAGYVLGIGLLGMERDPAQGEAALPNSVGKLLWMCAREIGIFGAVFGLAWWSSRASVEALYLKWRKGLMPVVWGALHSIFLRLGIAVAVMAVVIPYAALKGEKALEENMQVLRPKVESVVDTKALQDPAYFVVTMTVISFVVAGLREELWRAGMLAGLAGLAPAVFGSRKGRYFAVVLVAMIFGLAHAPQGIGGVALTGLLGIGLGVIMVAHRSTWIAALAHGFFDATTFALLFAITKVAPQFLKSFGIS